jgi:hypothetical protein
MDLEPTRPIRTHRAPSKFPIRFLIVAIVFLAGSISWAIVHHSSTPVANPNTLSVVEECQNALGYPARSPADIEWLQQCVSALTPPTVPPTTPPTAPPSGTTSPSTTPTSTAPPTTPPTPTPTFTTSPPTPSATTSPPASTTPPPSTSTSTSPSSGPCPVTGKDKPGATDHWGGCWPGPGNTGVPAGTNLTGYTGPCSITTANTVIDSKTVTCSTLTIGATNVVIRNSLLNGTDVVVKSNGSLMITDSAVVNGVRQWCFCIGDRNFVASRVEIRGGNRSMYCALNCTVRDSWLHGQQLGTFNGAGQHGSGLREEQQTTAIHNVLVCDYPIVNDNTSLGCSSDLTGYPDFAPIKNNTINRNLFLASSTVSFCAYGGATQGKPYSNDPTNATNQKFTENVFQRGPNGKCGPFGPITSFDVNRTGNVWSGNVWEDGATVPPAN